MSKFKNVSGRDFSVLIKGRRISIPPGSILEGPDSLKNYSALKEINQVEYDKHVKHMPKFMKANPMHKLRSFINSNSNSSEYAMRIQEKPVLESNLASSLAAAVYADSYPKDHKPPVFVYIEGENKDVTQHKVITLCNYSNVTFVNALKEIPDIPNIVALQISDGAVFDFDFITLIAKYSFNNKVSLPKPLVLSEITPDAVKNLILSHRIKKDVHITIATLVHNVNQYRDFVMDLSRQETDYKFEVIILPNFNKEFTSCAEPLNIALDLADGVVVNLCHQDLRVNAAWIDGISNHITNFARGNVKWGVLGMAGAYKYGKAYTPDVDANVLYLSDTTTASKKSFAAIYREVYGNYKEVQTLDELAMIVRKDSPFRFDATTFDHFHWYGADICLQALSMGYRNFAIDADCLHLSDGQGNLSGGHATAYVDGGIKLFKKWSTKFPYFKTTTGMFLGKEMLFIPLIFMLINRKNNNKNLPEIVKVT
jgi:hypothetical protein